ncbi:MAG: DUF1302 family protein [Gammaproteobacteria bacterium]|nr:DUF1302 family protein [Gammaproteobacteria bacterium]
MIVRLLWLMLCLATTAAPAASGDWWLGGTVAMDTAVQTADGRAQKAETTLMPEIEWRSPWGFDLTAIGRLRADALDRLQPGRPGFRYYDPASRPQALGTNGEIDLRELYADFYLGPLYLRLGKQQIVWGKTDGLKLLDRVNPQSLREFILPEFEQSRIPQWSLRAEFPLGPVWQAQLIAIADVSVDALPPEEGAFAVTSPKLVPTAPSGTPARIRPAMAPQHRFADGDVGARLSAFLGGWDVTLNYLYHYVDRPTFHRSTRPDGIAITPHYYRTHTVGGSAANAFGDFTVRSELAYATDRRLIAADPYDTDGVIDSREGSAMLGVDWMGLTDSIVSTQVFASWVDLSEGPATREELEWSITHLVERSFLNQALTLRGQAIHDINDGDGLLRASVTYDYRADVELRIGADFFYGPSEGRFGQFKHRDRITFSITRSF